MELPWSIPFGEVAIALMAGNGVVLKPASLTPLIGERIRQTFEKAGFPEGLIRTIHGGGRVGDALVKSTAGKIFFTGSVEIGRKVGVECAKRMKGSVLELGGKDPQIVCPDADLANAISGAVWGGFANAGQTCSGIERVYVHKDVADAFVEGVVRETERLTVGDPREWTTEIGPMVSDDQAAIVKELVDDATKSGAKKLTGGPTRVKGMKGSFIAPVVLTGITHEMRIMKEEIFGPVLPIITVDSEEEAVRLANDSEFGLGASVWTRTGRRASGSRTRSSRGWSGPMTTPSHTAPASARGAGSRTRVSGARIPSSASTSASTSSSSPGSRAGPATLVAAVRPTLADAIRSSPSPLQPERPPPEGAARGLPAAGRGHAPHPPQGRVAGRARRSTTSATARPP